MVNRYSSRLEKLDETFLNRRLKDAISYDRIAGYFRLSILEVAGEALESVQGPIRIVCNSDIGLYEAESEKAAQQAQRLSWNQWDPEELAQVAGGRLKRLVDMLEQVLPGGKKKLQVRILPNEAFGLIHGKAGVIRYGNEKSVAFLGSVNESLSAWKLNYELLWEDDSRDATDWVQKEFDALWYHHLARPLSAAVIEEIRRNVKRVTISIDKWNDDPDPASSVIETPVYRKEFGLWPHQKYFVNLAFQSHKVAGARYVLADQVGLGKTVQLALSGLLMTLYGGKPVLVIVPKSLIPQWQDELRDLLSMPSASWNGKGWVDENGIEHPAGSVDDIIRCPRKLGIVSQGLISRNEEVRRLLLRLRYECVMVDEAHRARRRKITERTAYQKGDPNNLLAFLREMSKKTRSMLFATATPVQLHPIEAWDLLDALSRGSNHVLGDHLSDSPWLNSERCLEIAMGQKDIPSNPADAWLWIRSPLPPNHEDSVFKQLRIAMNMEESEALAPSFDEANFTPGLLTLLKTTLFDYGRKYNPFIRHIVRRTRHYLEETIDPQTGEYYLKKVEARLVGEDDPVELPSYLQEAYNYAKSFCELLSKRVKGAGFLKTLVLRRIGSSMYAGKKTVTKMLKEWNLKNEGEEAYEEDEELEEAGEPATMKELTPDERTMLENCARALEASQQKDPKFQKVVEYLIERKWLDDGCIVFTQYFDSAWWLAEGLSQIELPEEKIGLYSSAQRSGYFVGGTFTYTDRETIKKHVRSGQIRLLIGTDAASEGLNLQRLGKLINLDLPWNPTRLEQRKGRIQRIGQVRDIVYIYNMRYRGSVEDRVHELLSSRLQVITRIFGQIPDVLEDVWINVALNEEEKAKKLIEEIPESKHPFDERYNKVENVDWESCAKVLDKREKQKYLMQGWQ